MEDLQETTVSSTDENPHTEVVEDFFSNKNVENLIKESSEQSESDNECQVPEESSRDEAPGIFCKSSVSDGSVKVTGYFGTTQKQDDIETEEDSTFNVTSQTEEWSKIRKFRYQWLLRSIKQAEERSSSSDQVVPVVTQKEKIEDQPQGERSDGSDSFNEMEGVPSRHHKEENPACTMEPTPQGSETHKPLSTKRSADNKRVAESSPAEQPCEKLARKIV